MATGDIVATLVINGLGFASTHYYLFINFFKNKALKILLKQGRTQEHFNKHHIDRIMD